MLWVAPHLEAVDLPLRMPLEGRNTPIEYVYFVEKGFASVVANGSGHRSIEVGLIGREGVTGLAVIIGSEQSPPETFIQLAGSGQRILSSRLRQAIGQSVSLHRVLLAYGHAFLVQTGFAALSNGRNTLEERLARWLLMARDRVDGDEIVLTHEFVALMLGVRRRDGNQSFGAQRSYQDNLIE